MHYLFRKDGIITINDLSVFVHVQTGVHFNCGRMTFVVIIVGVTLGSIRSAIR